MKGLSQKRWIVWSLEQVWSALLWHGILRFMEEAWWWWRPNQPLAPLLVPEIVKSYMQAYYPPGSHKVPVLEKLQKIGRENGVEELYMLEGEEAMNMEPQLKCVKALFSPLTGIIDSHGYMLALQASAEDSGVTFALKTTAVGGRLTKNGIDVVLQNTHSLWEEDSSTKGASERIVLSSRTVVNCAGLLAQAFVKGLNGFPSKFIPKNYLAKGSYFSFAEAAKSAFSHLVYPVPEEGGLGVHLTLDLASRVKFGPDEWLSAENIETNILTQFDYTVNQNRAQCFYAAIRTYYPSLPDNCLAPDYAGIRPKLSGPGEKPADFMIQGEDCHGVSGLVNLFGIESPGLTASLAIANFVHNKISKR
ncbi:hypothetical protein O6H91_10G098700 [Diphasiastrum complanatum]|uniref:Uncharacterized protein n=1 Tax=Diphasiastrum complanatum TaxID=34168 RepID=A0ACC2CJY6_DIPCM|nr:hypothetical protein O6H91_10G098700 [Diphasiastrum complanatum]